MSRESDAEDGFLSRWSRRKRAVAAEADISQTLPVEPEAPAVPALPADGAGLPGAAAADPEAAPEPEFIEPPSLDIIDKDFDLAHWLKQNVPESWKLAALRRTWETDPFIHGYLNPAREYALDWNTPGGAPGYGPLTESDDVKGMLAHIFGDGPKLDTAPSPKVGDSDAASHRPSDEAPEAEPGDAALPHAMAGDPDATADLAAIPVAQAPNPVRRTQSVADTAPTLDIATQYDPSATVPDPAPVTRHRRRGGGAVPV